MNTFELELLAACDEDAVSAAVLEFVRRRRRLPGYGDLVIANQGDVHLEAPAFGG